MASKQRGNTSKKAPAGSPAAAVKTAAQGATPRLLAPAVPAKTSAPSPGNVALRWSARGDGTADVLVAYEGPLASRDAVLARAGTWRSGGAPWADVQDVRLTRDAPGRFVGAIRISAGAPVEAVELAFHAAEEWDNGGRAPLGYYEWSLREQQLVVR